MFKLGDSAPTQQALTALLELRPECPITASNGEVQRFDVTDHVLALGEKKVRELCPLGSKQPEAKTNGHCHPDSVSAAIGNDCDDQVDDSELADEKRILQLLQLDVLGERPDDSIECFSGHHRKTLLIDDVNRINYAKLLQYVGLPAKVHVVEKAGEDSTDDAVEKVTVNDVRNAIAIIAGQCQIGEQTKLGPGCWQGVDESGREHPSIVLVGADEAAEFDQGASELKRINHPRCNGHLLDFTNGVESWFDADLLADYLKQCDREFAIETTKKATNLFKQWCWAAAPSPHIVVGLVLATWVQTLWRWRPQVAVIGQTKAGKSTLFQALTMLFGNLAISIASSTAAGIRQAIKTSARAVFVDEFERSKHRAEILEMLRLSGTGSRVLRGTTNQRGTTFGLQHIVWVAAIESGLRREPDRNRFITLEVERPSTDKRGHLVLPPESELSDLGQRLLAVAIKNAAPAISLARRLAGHRVSNVDTRIVEGYAVPAAMLAVVEGLSEADAIGRLEDLLVGVDRHDQGELADETQLLQGILSSLVTVSRGASQAASQLLEVVMNKDTGMQEAGTALAKVGLRYDSDDRVLDIAYSVVARHLLRGTDWEGQAIEQILGRIQGARKGRVRVGGHRQQVIRISKELLEREYLGHRDGDQASFL